MGGSDDSAHVLLLPYPSQGHINPLLQFGKQLAGHHGIRSTLAVTRFILGSTEPSPGPVHIATIFDGCDRAGYLELCDVPAYLTRLESAGADSLDELLQSESDQGRPVQVLVYDPFLPWAAEVARRRGVATAAFFSQACAVDAVYEHAWAGRLELPVQQGSGPVQLPGLPGLEPAELPGFLVGPGPASPYLGLVLNQFKGLELADGVLINSFYELQPQEADHVASIWRGKTIGPILPPRFLGADVDRGQPSDKDYGFDLVSLTSIPFMSWLDSQSAHSVVFVSFGSLNDLGPAQMAEVAHGILGTGKPFLWVVRSTEASKLPKQVTCHERGLVVSWCSQLEVLAHKAIGCFLTHCGWNSTLEALTLGVPMVAMPQWADQLTNAKYVQSVWEVGLRAWPDVEGTVRREEVERCVREVMEGEKKEVYRRNAVKWMEKAREAVKEGGSSERNFAEFVAKYSAKGKNKLRVAGFDAVLM